MKHVPLRTCIVCREQKEKPELLRIVRKPDGEFCVDGTGKAPGRGAYICKGGDCIAQAQKKHALDRAYKTSISAETYEKLLAAFAEYNGTNAG